jgi:hypothetical protein
MWDYYYYLSQNSACPREHQPEKLDAQSAAGEYASLINPTTSTANSASHMCLRFNSGLLRSQRRETTAPNGWMTLLTLVGCFWPHELGLFITFHIYNTKDAWNLHNWITLATIWVNYEWRVYDVRFPAFGNTQPPNLAWMGFSGVL